MSERALILLVEDREDDVLLIRRAFTKARVLNPIQVARSGEEAIEYLKGEGKFRRREEFPLPSLVLLDIKMPGVSGFDVLTWIRNESAFSSLRVVMLTSSDEIKDVNMAYQLGANSFLVKPLDFERFVEITQALSGYWLWLDRAPEAAADASAGFGSAPSKELFRRVGLDAIAETSEGKRRLP